MNVFKSLTVTSIALACAPVFAEGDADAGKATYEDDCANCHYEDDFADEAESDLATMLAAIRSGETRHRPPLKDLTDEEIANLAAFFASQ